MNIKSNSLFFYLFLIVISSILFIGNISDNQFSLYIFGESEGCTSPSNGDWIVTSSCVITQDMRVNNGNLILENNSILTISDGLKLYIDLINYNIQIKQGSGILIKQGGAILDISQEPKPVTPPDDFDNDEISDDLPDNLNQTPPPFTDTDNDGIPDDKDQCPTQKETINGIDDGDGCPDVLPSTQTPTPQSKTSIIQTDKSIYESDGKNPITITIAGEIMGHSRINPVAELTLAGSNGILKSEVVGVKKSGSFTHSFSLFPNEIKSGKYSISIKYPDQDIKPIEFGIVTIQQEPPMLPKTPPPPDDSPPSIYISGNRAVKTANPDGSFVSYEAIVTDVEDGELQPECKPKSGDLFSIGTTKVICIAIDSAGNRTIEEFPFTVEYEKQDVGSININGNKETNSEITFTVNIDDSSNDVEIFEWQFGDSQERITTKGKTTTHIFENKGEYTVTVKAFSIDSDGNFIKIIEKNIAIEIAEPEPPYWLAYIGAITGIIIGLAKLFMSRQKSEKKLSKSDNTPSSW